MNVVSFSGGKDSTAMLLMMIEKKVKIDRIVCIDTSKEFPEMYAHIQKVQDYIFPLEIEIVKINFDYWFGKHIKTKGKNKGKVGYGWPDFRNRWCTALKRDAVKRTIDGNCTQFHGIAFDEKCRADKNISIKTKYPLIEWGITEKQALKYCYSKGFNWGGLYEDFSRVSCWCCPLSQIGELKTLYNKYPKLWSELEKMDKKSYRKFRNDYSVSDLKAKFNKAKQQTTLNDME